MAKLNKQSKTLIVVGSVIVVLLAVLLILLPLLPATEEEKASMSSSSTLYTILDADLSDIQNISVQNSSGGFTVKRINDENFDVPELKGFDIIQENIDFFPDAVRVMKTDLLVNENPEDLSIFGLEEPAATVEYTMTDGSTFGLELGNQVTGETNYYVKITGKPEVYVLTSSVAGYFFIPKEDFVSRTVLPEASEVYTEPVFRLPEHAV